MMKPLQRQVCVVAAVLVFVSCVAAKAAKRNADVIYVEPELDTSYASDIHPYAYAYRYPDPHYAVQHAAHTPLPEFRSFLDLQDHVVVGSDEAKKLTMTPEIVSASSSPSAPVSFVSEHESSGILPLLAGAANEAAGAKYLTVEDGVHGPGQQFPMTLEPHPSPFYDPSRQTGSGYKENYRRATYGLRRRRMPFTFNALTSSLNPFRRPNSFMNTPQDALFPRVRYLEALNPATTDYGRYGGPGMLPYGGHSSFAAQRHMVSNPGSIGGMGNMAPFSMGVASPPWLQNYASLQDPFRARQGVFPFNVGSHPQAGGPSPYIAGTYKFFDFYGGGGGAAGGGAAGGKGGAEGGGGEGG